MNEEVLSGLDGPRPLPPALRQQLEDRLLADTSRPLEPELAGRLASALSDRPSGARLRRFGRARVGAAAAAAGLLIAGGVTLSLGQPGRARPAAVSGRPAPRSTASPAAPAPAPSAVGAGSASIGSLSIGSSLNPSNPQLNQSSAAGSSGAPSAGASPAGPLYGVAATLTPDHGPATGGTWVTITGPHLTGTSAVRFGSRPAARYTVVSDSQIRALTPPGAGLVRVTVVPASGVASPGLSSLTFTYTG